MMLGSKPTKSLAEHQRLIFGLNIYREPQGSKTRYVEYGVGPCIDARTAKPTKNIQMVQRMVAADSEEMKSGTLAFGRLHSFDGQSIMR